MGDVTLTLGLEEVLVNMSSCKNSLKLKNLYKMSVTGIDINLYHYVMNFNMNMNDCINIKMITAALNGHIEIVKNCKERGATNYNATMYSAAENGHVEIVKLCKEWGATDYNMAMFYALKNGHVEIVRLCREYGATMFNMAMETAAENGHMETVKLCRECLDYGAIHDELYQYHHKKKVF